MENESIQIKISKRGLLAIACSLFVNLFAFVVADFFLEEEVRPLVVRMRPASTQIDPKEEEEVLKRLESESFKIRELTLKKGDTIKDVSRTSNPQKEETKPKAPKATKVPRNKSQEHRPEKLSLDQLALEQTPADIPTPAPTPTLRASDLGEIKSPTEARREQEALTKRQILNEFAANPEVAKVFDTKGFNMEFGLPEGLNETDLNSKELIYFAFLKRNFLKYLTTFLSTHNRLVVVKPALDSALRTGPHILTARAIYDENGHMISFKILKSSHDNNIHALFEETIKGMTTIPNPPKDFVKGRDREFSVYYQLQINAR